MSILAFPTKMTSSGIVTAKSAELWGVLIGCDGVNDPTITIYNGTDNSGNEIVPTNTYDASILGINGAILPFGLYAPDGLYVEITCAGAVEVVAMWRNK